MSAPMRSYLVDPIGLYRKSQSQTCHIWLRWIMTQHAATVRNITWMKHWLTEYWKQTSASFKQQNKQVKVIDQKSTDSWKMTKEGIQVQLRSLPIYGPLLSHMTLESHDKQTSSNMKTPLDAVESSNKKLINWLDIRLISVKLLFVF